MDSSDVIVLGGGVAGVAAALAAAAAGARVALVRAGPGATALGGGGWSGRVPAGLRTALADAGHPLATCDGALPHPDGRVIAYDHAAPAQAAAGLDTEHREAPVLVCGIEGLPSFRARALAALWTAAARLDPGMLRAADLTLPDTPAAGWSAPALARLLEHEPDRLGTPLAAAVAGHGAARVILPAVLGIDGHAQLHTAVQRGAGAPVGEALGVAPSLPGWRLDRALLRALDAAGVRVIAGRVTARATDGHTLRSITVAVDAGTTEHTAAAFILATGKFVGGGIAAEPEFGDSALGLMPTLERFGRTFDDAGAALALTDPVRTEPQPLLGLGVATDAATHPLTASGEVAFDNVFVAGSVRAGVETASLGLGAAAHEGWAAGERAARPGHGG